MYQDPQKRAKADLDAEFAVLRGPAPEAPQVAPADPGGEVHTPPADPPPPEAPQAAPAQPQAPQPEAPQQPAPPVEPETVPKARFDTLQGKYNAEVPRLNSENRNLRTELDRLSSELTAMKEAEPAKSDPAATAYSQLVDEYGEPAAQAVREIARKIAQEEANRAAEAQVAPLADTVALQSRESFHDRIAAAGAGVDWIDVNNTPDFTNWTFANSDPNTGQTFNEQLNQAYSNGNAQQVARFFKMFHEATVAPPPPQPTPPPAPPNPGVSPKDAMTAPPARGTNTQQITDGSSPDRVWSTREIEVFFDDVARGKYQKNPNAADAIKAEISAAYRDNRVMG